MRRAITPAPVVTATSKPVAKYATLLASGLFSVTDSDGDLINQYQIKDATISSLSGHFEIGGVAQGANKTLTLSDTQMSSLTYVSGSVADDLWVRGYDGKDWSDWKTFRLTPPVNHAPVVTPSNTPVTKNSTVAASMLFSVSDSDSDAITQYQFKDASASITSGHFAIGGVAQASQTVLTASAAQLPLVFRCEHHQRRSVGPCLRWIRLERLERVLRDADLRGAFNASARSGCAAYAS